MALEIERKFLVVDQSWRALTADGRHILDHLIARFDLGKARIRVCDNTTTLTIKSARRGFSRSEYHIELTEADGQAMIADFARSPGLEKSRYEIRVNDVVWQVDEYLGPLLGLVTADVELPSEDHHFDKPDWVGEEITGDSRYSSSTLSAAVEAVRLMPDPKLEASGETRRG
ncbi:MAG: CYTH domain-containing protein [Pseudorhizobium sp.]